MEPISIQEKFLNLNQDPESDIEILTIFEGDVNYIIAELKPSKILKPHYHKNGTEIYQVLSGMGILELGELVDGKINWQHSHKIRSGDVIEVEEEIVHQLKNLEDVVLQLVFIAPKGHLDEDRYFV